MPFSEKSDGGRITLIRVGWGITVIFIWTKKSCVTGQNFTIILFTNEKRKRWLRKESVDFIHDPAPV